MKTFTDRESWKKAAREMNLDVYVLEEGEYAGQISVAKDADGDDVGLWGWWNVESEEPSGVIAENAEEIGDLFGN